MKSEILLAELHVERADRLRLIINMKIAEPRSAASVGRPRRRVNAACGAASFVEE
jgi:hypothetical protein